MHRLFDSHHGVAGDHSRFNARRTSLFVRTVAGAAPKLAASLGLLRILASVRFAVVIDAQEAAVRLDDLREKRELCTMKRQQNEYEKVD